MKHMQSLYIALVAITLRTCGPAPVFADTFSGNLSIVPNWIHRKTVGASNVEERFSSLLDWSHTTGTNANQMSVIVREQTTLTNAQTRTLNLSGGVYNSFGDLTTFFTVRFLCITTPATNTDPISLGGAAANAWAPWGSQTNQTLTIRPGGAAVLLAPDATGYPVTTNAHNLLISNTGTNANSYAIYIGGCQ